MTGSLDRLLQDVLIIVGNASDPAGQNFASFGDKLLERFEIFVVDRFYFISSKRTGFAFLRKYRISGWPRSDGCALVVAGNMISPLLSLFQRFKFESLLHAFCAQCQKPDQVFMKVVFLPKLADSRSRRLEKEDVIEPFALAIDLVGQFFSALLMYFLNLPALFRNPVEDLVKGLLAGVIAERRAQNIHPLVEGISLLYHFFPCMVGMNLSKHLSLNAEFDGIRAIHRTCYSFGQPNFDHLGRSPDQSEERLSLLPE